MRPVLRPPLVPLLLLAVVAGLLVGCTGDTDADAGPTVVASGQPDPTTPGTPGTPSTPAGARTTGSASLAPAVCAPYAAMVSAIEDAALTTRDPEQVAAAIAPVMKRFAARVATLPQPPGMGDATWQGVVALADRIRTLPARPSSADIESVEEELTAEQRAAVEDAADWFKATCGH